MDAAVLVRDARHDPGRAAVLAARGLEPSRPQTAGLLLPVPVRRARTEPLRAGEGVRAEEQLPRSACGVSSGFLPVHLHRAAAPHRQHEHADRAVEGGVRDPAGRALRPGSVLHPGVPQGGVQDALSLLGHRRPPEPGGRGGRAASCAPGSPRLRALLLLRDAGLTGRGALHLHFQPGGEVGPVPERPHVPVVLPDVRQLQLRGGEALPAPALQQGLEDVAAAPHLRVLHLHLGALLGPGPQAV